MALETNTIQMDTSMSPFNFFSTKPARAPVSAWTCHTGSLSSRQKGKLIFLNTHPTNDITAKADVEFINFKQPSNLNAVEYSQARSLKFHCFAPYMTSTKWKAPLMKASNRQLAEACEVNELTTKAPYYRSSLHALSLTGPQSESSFLENSKPTKP